MLGKTRTLALVAAVVVTGSIALVHQATASHQVTHKAFSGGSTFKGLVVKTESAITGVTANSPNFQLIDSRGFQIPAGDSQLVAVDFFAETLCSAPAARLCEARVLIGRTLGTAQEAEPAGGTILDNTSAGFESHAMSNALCVRNATASPVDISVFVEASREASDTTFLIGRNTLKIARNSTCTPAVNI